MLLKQSPFNGLQGGLVDPARTPAMRLCVCSHPSQKDRLRTWNIFNELLVLPKRQVPVLPIGRASSSVLPAKSRPTKRIEINIDRFFAQKSLCRCPGNLVQQKGLLDDSAADG